LKVQFINIRRMKTYLILLIIFIAGYSYGQIPTVISIPILESTTAQQIGIIVTMSGVIQDLEKAESDFREAMKRVTWICDLQSAKRLLFMVDNLVCTSKSLVVLVGYADRNSSCLINYWFEISLAKISLSADYLGILLTDGVSMSIGDRMQTMNLAQEQFQQANEEFLRLKDGIEAQVLARELSRLGGIMLLAVLLYLGIFWPISVTVNKIAVLTEPSA